AAGLRAKLRVRYWNSRSIITSSTASAHEWMRQEAHLRQDWWSKGAWTDTLIFGMLASDR
ncbi:hypothetical protein, partial [Ancrocorticia populi]|uniref:hypothetical protein n=1 Tax=Ancrocorticia populi TaxID=2175228 RepID=UPI003F9AF2CE